METPNFIQTVCKNVKFN